MLQRPSDAGNQCWAQFTTAIAVITILAADAVLSLPRTHSLILLRTTNTVAARWTLAHSAFLTRPLTRQVATPLVFQPCPQRPTDICAHKPMRQEEALFLGPTCDAG